MKILFNKYPIDVILFMLYSLILIPIILSQVEEILTIILGLPFILFIPGYVLIFALFPTKKTDQGIDFFERIALSLGFSIAIVALIGVGLNFAPGGIQMISALISIFIFVIGVGTIAIYRWFKTNPDERLVVSLDLSISKPENKIERILTVILMISIIFTIATFIFVIATPKKIEKSTEFYILGPNNEAENYIRNLSAGKNTNLIIGIKNHEYQTINYTIEIWLINQTNVYNESTKENQTIVNNMWFMDKINVVLDHVNTDGIWEPQWEYIYTFNISKRGENLKLDFLLFKAPTQDYASYEDYKSISEQKISTAYEETHLWLNIN